jgi:hypothetical protein
MKYEANHVDRRFSPGARGGRSLQYFLTIAIPSQVRNLLLSGIRKNVTRRVAQTLDSSKNQVRGAPSFSRSVREGGGQRPKCFRLRCRFHKGVAKQ